VRRFDRQGFERVVRCEAVCGLVRQLEVLVAGRGRLLQRLLGDFEAVVVGHELLALCEGFGGGLHLELVAVVFVEDVHEFFVLGGEVRDRAQEVFASY